MGKYKNKRIEYDGQKFDSKKEFERWLVLKGYERSRLIKDLQRQVPYELIPNIYENKKVVQHKCTYKADFVYYDVRKKKIVVEDTKGYRTKEYLIKKKLMRWRYGIEIMET